MSSVELKTLSPSQLLSLYNEAAVRLKQKTVARFSDVEVALRRTTKIMAELEDADLAGDEPAKKGDDKPKAEAEAEAKPSRAKVAAKVKPSRAKVAAKVKASNGAHDAPKANGSESHYWPANATNPRKFGSFGFKSYEVIRKHPGISHSEFLERGGRTKDVAWDLKNGSVSRNKVDTK